MKNFLLGVLTALVLVLCSGAVLDNGPYKLVRNRDGRLLIVDMGSAKATYVTMESRYVPSDIDAVHLDAAGWSEFPQY